MEPVSSAHPPPSRPARSWRRFVVHPWRQYVLTEHPAWERFFARRCTHLAGMIAYFAILSIIPAAFLFVSSLALAGYLESQGWLVEQLTYVMPEQGVDTIVATVEYLRERSGSLGVIGAIALIWSTSNFFSSIETGLNIIYGVNNRPFLKQKAWVLFLMFVALACMTIAVIFATFALPLLERADQFADTFLHIRTTDAALSVGVSLVFAFLFFLSCYRFLPNTYVRTRDAWRGALVASLGFELSIHALPLYLSFSQDSVVFKAFAGALIMLVWFYLMALILLAGGVYNWWRAEKRRLGAEAATHDARLAAAAIPGTVAMAGGVEASPQLAAEAIEPRS